MNVQRYSVEWAWEDVVADKNGEYVKFEDYQDLQDHAEARIKDLEEALQAANARIKALEDGIREHWQESTHGVTANMQLADWKLHRLIRPQKVARHG